MTTTHTWGDGTRWDHGANPLALLISTIRETGGNEEQHKAAFKRLLADPDYEEFCGAVIDEWLSIKYSTALQAAHPPTAAQLKQHSDTRHARIAEQRQAVEILKHKIKGRLLQLIMPNGKRLAECTGAECIEFGGWYIAIGEHVGSTNLVGKVLKESEILQLLGRQS